MIRCRDHARKGRFSRKLDFRTKVMLPILVALIIFFQFILLFISLNTNTSLKHNEDAMLPFGLLTHSTMPTSQKCAICLWGLPRAFKSIVLPSLEQNVIRPNAKSNCDYFVHFY